MSTYIPAPPHIKAPPLSFATRTGDLIFVSGIPGFNPNGALPDEFTAQFANVITSITATFKRVRCGFPRP